MKTANGYSFAVADKDLQILEAAAKIIERRYLNKEHQPDLFFTCSEDVKKYVTFKLAKYEHEVFSIMFLDIQHRLIEYKEMFSGTIDQANVYPREVVKVALKLNASCVILIHNHPSGDSTPSRADEKITKVLIDILNVVGVRVLDHLIVGEKTSSLQELGLGIG